MKQLIRIALADDHKLVRSGIISILAAVPHFQVVLEAANGQELLDGIDAYKPDVVLLDLDMPVLSGKETLETLRKQDSKTRVLILTMHQSDSFIVQMMELGANGYVLKDSDPQEVIDAIEKVYHSNYYFSQKTSMAMLKGIAPATVTVTASTDHHLTEREVDVLKLICQEKTTPEIADLLFLSPKTIEGYRKVLMEKIGAKNMAGLVLFAVSKGLVEPLY